MICPIQVLVITHLKLGLLHLILNVISNDSTVQIKLKYNMAFYVSQNTLINVLLSNVL